MMLLAMILNCEAILGHGQPGLVRSFSMKHYPGACSTEFLLAAHLCTGSSVPSVKDEHEDIKLCTNQTSLFVCWNDQLHSSSGLFEAL